MHLVDSIYIYIYNYSKESLIIMVPGQCWICTAAVGQWLAFIYPKLTIKTSQASEHSDPLKCPPGSHAQLVSCSVGIMSSCSLLAFSLLVSLASDLPVLLGISN